MAGAESENSEEEGNSVDSGRAVKPSRARQADFATQSSTRREPVERGHYHRAHPNEREVGYAHPLPDRRASPGFLAPRPAIGQSDATDGALEGLGQDPSDASVPAATLVATGLRTGAVTTVTSDAEGYYRLRLLQVGEYELLVTAPNFAEYRQNGIRLSAGQRARVDLALTIGGASETVQ